MAAVAVVVVLVAGFLAWKSRPQVSEVASDAAATASGPSPGGAGAGRAPASGAGPGGEIVVAVGGKVRRPGLVRLVAGARVADALEAAGGAEPGVDVAPLNLARKVVDGELIMVGASAPPGMIPGAATPGAAGGLINLNTATLGQLDSLPGVGPVLAQRILDARDAQGGFRAVTDLRKVDGIGESRYEQLKDLVTV
jgi:competence protein ComEA